MDFYRNLPFVKKTHNLWKKNLKQELHAETHSIKLKTNDQMFQI